MTQKRADVKHQKSVEQRKCATFNQIEKLLKDSSFRCGSGDYAIELLSKIDLLVFQAKSK